MRTISRKKKIIRNILIIAILFCFYLLSSGLYLSPLSAHEHSERSIHYGPSKVVHVQDYEKGKYILGKYDRWISCNTVDKSLLFFWRFGSQPIGFENDQTKIIDYTWHMSHDYYKLYGIINDDRVEKIQITLGNGKILTQTEFYDDLFLFTWKDDKGDNESCYFKSIVAFDSENQVVLKKEG